MELMDNSVHLLSSGEDVLDLVKPARLSNSKHKIFVDSARQIVLSVSMRDNL